MSGPSRQNADAGRKKQATAKAIRRNKPATATSDDTVASLRRANAELQNRLDEALARETATAEVLGVINSSPGDLGPVFDAMLQKAVRLCEADCGQLATFDGEFFRFVAAQGDADVVSQLLALPPIAPSQGLTWPSQARGANIVHIANIRDAEAYRVGSEAAREFWDAAGARTLLSVSLRKEEVLLGTITVYRRVIRPFSDKQIALLQNFAAQAVIAMENARLITETREALDQQTATSEVLQVINSSPGELAPVFDAMLEKAVRLCEAEAAHLLRYENGAFNRAASLGVAEDFDKILPLGQPLNHVMNHKAGPMRVLASRAVVHMRDTREDQSYVSGSPAEVAAVEQGGIRTALFVPLLREGEVVGCFVMHRLVVREFSDKQIALLQNFAAQAVIAMENARLITETREALDQQTATAEVLGVINSSPGDLAPVFDAMLEKAMRFCDNDKGEIFLLRDGAYHLAGSRGLDPTYIEVEEKLAILPGNDTLVGRVALEKRPVHILDAMADPAYRPKDDIRLAGTHTILGVPLLRDGGVIGVICTAKSKIEAFSVKQIELLQTFASQAVIALENARLITETREALDQQTATAEVLGVINSSPGDLKPVFDAILEKAMRLCEAVCGQFLRMPVSPSGRRSRCGPVAAVRVRKFVQWDVKVIREIPRLRLRPGAVPDPSTFDTGYAEMAIASWSIFERLQRTGIIPASVKFQVSLPTPIAPVYNNMVPADRPGLLPALTRHLLGEVAAIAAAIPNDRLALQWDVCQEVLAWEGYYEPGPIDTRTETLAVLTEIGEGIPAGVELGYHLCYGSPADEHLVQPKDAGLMVEMTNAVSARVRRPVHYFHLPVPKNHTDDAYFAPLAGLALHPDTQLYLGLIHYDDAAGNATRLAAARRHARVDGIATECGMARGDPARLPALLTAHATLAERGS